jgi:hypothetical protein
MNGKVQNNLIRKTRRKTHPTGPNTNSLIYTDKKKGAAEIVAAPTVKSGQLSQLVNQQTKLGNFYKGRKSENQHPTNAESVLSQNDNKSGKSGGLPLAFIHLQQGPIKTPEFDKWAEEKCMKTTKGAVKCIGAMTGAGVVFGGLVTKNPIGAAAGGIFFGGITTLATYSDNKVFRHDVNKFAINHPILMDIASPAFGFPFACFARWQETGSPIDKDPKFRF